MIYTMKIVILDAYAQNPGDLSWDFLSKYGETEIYDRTPADLIYERSADADILVTNKTPISAELIDRLPKLKFVATLSTGYNIVDVKKLAERGIPVSNIPAYSTHAVAQLVFSFMLEHCTHTALHSESVRRGDWSRNPDFTYHLTPLYELDGKTIGIIGLGKIGADVAKKANAFGMETLVYAPRRRADAPDYIRYVTLGELLEKSDFVTLHCPLTDETAGMVNRDFLSKMKNSAFLINTSRGGAVNSSDLADALNSGVIAGAGLDVMESEPPKPDDPLLTAKNCIITPHIAWAAFETRKRLMDIFEQNISAFISGSPINTVN